MGRVPSLGGVNDKGETDLHIVAKLNLPMLTISLLNWGAEVNAKNNRGSTSLDVAVGLNAREAAEVLRRYGGLR